MRSVMVRYRVKPDRVAENEALVRAVYEELRDTTPEGLRYATFRLPDGVSFVHFALEAISGDEPSRLSTVDAFRRFQENIADRLEEGPVVSPLEEIGSYRLPA
jgi:hypothetical protein